MWLSGYVVGWFKKVDIIYIPVQIALVVLTTQPPNDQHPISNFKL